MNISEIASRSVSIDSADGEITLTECDISSELDIDVAFADVTLSDCRIKGSVDIETSAGDINLTLLSAPRSMDIESASGNANITLPKNTNATIEFGTASGSSEVTVAHVTENGKIKLGTGEYEYEISLVSGKLTVK